MPRPPPAAHRLRREPNANSTYNERVVPTCFRLRRRLALGPGAGVVLVLATLLLSGLWCRAQAPASAASPAPPDRGRILLVLPFDNRSGQPNLEWIREAAADLLTSRFASAGFAPMTRADREYALDHLGLPPGFQPSRASALKLAQTLDADSIVVGSFSLDGKDIVAEGQIVNVPHLRMTEPVSARGPMDDMVGVFDSLAWKLTRELDPRFSVAESTFVAAGRNIRIAAYEQYIRGITEPDQAERLRHLQQAVKLSPDFSPAWMALGREQYNAQQYDQAALAFAKVDRGSDALEAGFDRGLSLLYSGNYPGAQQAFVAVARTLPLASVVNNEGVAVSRQGHDGTALFVQAAADDPDNPDYHFNLAVSLMRHGNGTAAANELEQCLKLRPGDSEALSLLDAWKHPAVTPASTGGDPPPDPLERIARTFDAAAFRQAAQMLDQIDAARMKALAQPERAQMLCAQASGYLDRGLLLEAERLYREAAAGDPQSVEAHVGLARVRQHTGDLNGARKEAQAALALDPSAGAYVILAQLDLAGNHLKEAEDEARSALRIEPTSAPAEQVLQQILARTGHPQ